jgi:ATP-dependent helicase HrpA
VIEPEAVDDTAWRRDGIVAWDFGDLPEQVELERSGVTLHAYPALVDQGQSVSLRLFDSPQRAAAAMRGGLLRLYAIAANRELKGQVAWIPRMDQLRLLARSLSTIQPLEQQVAELIAVRAFIDDQLMPRSQEEFRLCLKTGRARMGGAVHDAANLIGPLLEAHHQLRLALDAARPPQWRYVLEDIREQLARLTRPRFLVETPWEWLQHYPRYLAAMRLRLDKLAGPGLARDQRNFQQLDPFWRKYVEASDRHAEQGTHDPELERFGWLLEEFRVSLFAQELGTAVTVSAKRLEQQWGQ